MITVDPTKYALFLDLDGTLLDIQVTPRDVEIPDGLIATLRQLIEKFGGAVAIVTGRRIDDADRLLSPLQLVTAGVHGIEIRLTPGGPVSSIEPTFPISLLGKIMSFTRNMVGIEIEPKGAAVSVHYRNAPEQRDKLERELISLLLGRGQSLELSHGRMVFEILPKAYSKGHALAALANTPSFLHRKPIMIGDDAPDVPALKMAEELGGIGLKVAGEHFGLAEAHFAGPREVRRWLGQLNASTSIDPLQLETKPPTGV